MDCLIGHLVMLNEALLQASDDFGVEPHATAPSSALAPSWALSTSAARH